MVAAKIVGKREIKEAAETVQREGAWESGLSRYSKGNKLALNTQYSQLVLLLPHRIALYCLPCTVSCAFWFAIMDLRQCLFPIFIPLGLFV